MREADTTFLPIPDMPGWDFMRRLSPGLNADPSPDRPRKHAAKTTPTRACERKPAITTLQQQRHARCQEVRTTLLAQIVSAHEAGTGLQIDLPLPQWHTRSMVDGPTVLLL